MAESVIIPVTVQVSGQEKVQALSRALEELSRGTKLNKYWKDHQKIIDNMISSYEEYTTAVRNGNAGASRMFGADLIKNANALKAALDLSGKAIEDFDFKGFDATEIFNAAETLEKSSLLMENIGRKYSKQNFKDYGVALDYMKDFDSEIGNVFEQLANSSGGEARIRQLTEELENSDDTIKTLKSTISELEDKVQSFSSGEKFSEMQEKCKALTDQVVELKVKISRANSAAEEEFSAFLKANNLDAETYGQFEHYFKKIQEGYYSSSQEAIQDFKMYDNEFLGKDLDIDTTQMQQFITVLGNVSSTVAEVKSEMIALAQQIENVGQKAPLQSIADGLSRSEDLTEEQRTQLAAMAREASNLDSVAQIISVIASETKNADTSMETLYSTITEFANALKNLGDINFDSLKSIEGIFRSISSFSGFDVKKSSFDELYNFINKLNSLESTGNARLFSGLDFSGFKGLQVRKSTITNLIDFINSVNGANLSGLQDLSGLNLDWLSNLKISKVSKGSLDELKNFLVGIKDINVSGLKDLSEISFDKLNALKLNKASISNLTEFVKGIKDLNLSSIKEELAKVNFDDLNTLITDNIKPIDTSKLLAPIDVSTEEDQISQLAEAIRKVITAIGDKNDAFVAEQQVVSGVVGNELTELGTLWATIDDIATAAKDINPGKMFSTNSFNKMIENIKKFSSNEFETLNRLAKIDLSKLSINTKGKSFEALTAGLEKLSNLNDLSKLKVLSDVDLSGFSNIKVGEKSFTNLVNGIKELSGVDLSELQKLAGIDFTGLSNLKYAGKAENGLVKQSKNFIDSQNKQIESALKRYRSAGIDEFDLQEIKDLRQRLNSDFTPGSMLDMSDVNSQMQTFVGDLSQAVNKCDELVQKKKELDTNNKNVDSNIKKLENLYSAEDTLLRKRLKDGKLNNKDTFDLENIQNQIAETQKLVQGEKEYQDVLARRQAMQKDYYEEYNSKINNAISSSEKILNNKPSNNVDDKTYAALKDAVAELELLKRSESDIISDDDITKSKELLNNIQNLQSFLTGWSKSKGKTKGDLIGRITGFSDIDDAKQQIRDIVKAQADLKGARLEYDGFSNNNTQLNYRLISKNGTVQSMVATWNQATGAVTDYMRKETEYVSQSQKFINSIKGKFAELTRYISIMDVVQKGMQFVRSGISAIVDINTAMTELKKVTDETATTYERFGKTAGNIATEVGSTRKEITNSTADFARLGYSMEEATQLAKNAAIYVNVGDGIDINEATENIISTLRGFQMDVSDVSHMIDVFNEVANNTPIDAGGLGDALKRSAASFYAANTDMNEAISLIVGANSVIQNPEKVGNMWKTVSMRIRGAKVELEEAGEDTDGMVESTSQLRDIVKGMTGFDIMENDTTYKNMKDIIVGIGKEWDKLSDLDRAGLLEKLAGKVQSNALAAALENYELIEETYNYTQTAQGSALAENEKYLQSIEGRIQVLTSSFQNLWANGVDDGFLTFWIDLGTNILNVVDDIGLLQTAMGAVVTAFSFNGAGRANVVI